MQCNCGSTAFTIEEVFEFHPNAATSEWGHPSEVKASLMAKRCIRCHKIHPEPLGQHQTKDEKLAAKQELRKNILTS